MKMPAAVDWTLALAMIALAACEDSPTRGGDTQLPPDPQEVFRFETFGNETWWTDTLQMPRRLLGSADRRVR